MPGKNYRNPYITNNPVIQFTMKKLIILVLAIGIGTTLQAQNTIYWKGGTPGEETKWYNPKNWSPNRIPASNDIVVIPNCSSHGCFYPELAETAAPIAHLRVESGAVLTIQKGGYLSIDGSATFNDGISLFGTILNYGHISIIDAGVEDIDNPFGHFVNHGVAIIDSKESMAPLAQH